VNRVGYVAWLLCRRIREVNENNTKKFIEERKRQAILQSRQIEATRKTHQEQLAKLTKTLDWVTLILSFVAYNKIRAEFAFKDINRI